MSDIIIKVENLSKRYFIGESVTNNNLREVMVHAIQAPIRRLMRSADKNQAQSKEDRIIWALRDVTLEVREGEILGIIGRNGAGKSTLLKILSRITKPTSGSAEIYGRVGSLLEVGTGFHSELTGRENIYLNGAILGMKRAEIDRKFDEIVDFSEIEKFLDTPVKRYSSGMYVRLAFAVAAHLEPEILIVDEVLAVGDAAFQKKCLGKMSDVADGGRTVLFVSHNMAAIQNLCKRGLYLEKGQIIYQGDLQQAINQYLGTVTRIKTNLENREDRKGSGKLKFRRVWITDEKGNSLDTILTGQDIKVCIEYTSERKYDAASVILSFNVYNSQGVLLTNLNTRDVNQMQQPIGQIGRFECSWPRFNLRSGIYSCALFCELNGTIVDWVQAAFQLVVEDGDYFGTGSLVSREQGDILVPYSWFSFVEK